MTLRILPKGAFKTWAARLQERQFRIVGPKAKYGQFVYDEITDLDELVLDYPQTVAAPKRFLLPPREVLFSFNTETMEMHAQIEAEPTVIIGLHTCDMHAIDLIDLVQNTGFADQHYRARRDALYLVSIECLSPCTENCFCKDMETFSAPENFDLHLIDLGTAYAVEVGSEKGEQLLDGCVNVWEPSEAEEAHLNEVMSAKWQRFDFRLDATLSELPEVLGEAAHSVYWDELGDICLACGACTQVCPTCYCFDVTDEIDLTLTEGQRVRTWDSCQIERFAVVAGNHNFRSQLGRRQRHRFMRKGKYQYEAYGKMGCVGCGRCAAACPVNISCIKTFNHLTAEQRTHDEEVTV